MLFSWLQGRGLAPPDCMSCNVQETAISWLTRSCEASKLRGIDRLVTVLARGSICTQHIGTLSLHRLFCDSIEAHLQLSTGFTEHDLMYSAASEQAQ